MRCLTLLSCALRPYGGCCICNHLKYYLYAPLPYALSGIFKYRLLGWRGADIYRHPVIATSGPSIRPEAVFDFAGLAHSRMVCRGSLQMLGIAFGAWLPRGIPIWHRNVEHSLRTDTKG